MKGLGEYYPGDYSWEMYYKVFSEDLASAEYNKLNDVLGGQSDLARVIYDYAGPEQCLGYVSAKIPALGNESVLDTLSKGDLKSVRTLLMRLH